jgi:uncharacterized cupredoxin-like copper-binding protein
MKRFVLIAALAVLPTALSAQAAPAAKPIEVTLTEWKLALPSDTLTAGAITFNVRNDGNMNHAFYVLGGNVAQGTKEIAVRQSATLKVTLKPGDYEIYCPMSDQSHKMAGMSRKITVVAPAASKKP